MKKKTLSFRPEALEDIRDIVRHIASDRPRASHAFEEALDHACSLLAEMPGLGMSRNFGRPALSDIRLWPIGRFEKYLLVYRVRGDTLDVVRVVHGARDLPAIFSEPED